MKRLSEEEIQRIKNCLLASDVIMLDVEMLVGHIAALESDNARLREALEKIPYGSCMTSDGRACLCCSVAIKIATNALAERQEGCGDDG